MEIYSINSENTIKYNTYYLFYYIFYNMVLGQVFEIIGWESSIPNQENYKFYKAGLFNFIQHRTLGSHAYATRPGHEYPAGKEVIIKSSDKNYLFALYEADTGNI